MKKFFIFPLYALLILLIAVDQLYSINLPAYIKYCVTDFSKTIEYAQEDFSTAYFNELLQNEKFYSEITAHELTDNVNWDFTKNSLFFMKMIDFFEEKNTPEAINMLAKLHEIFILLFHRLIIHSDIIKEKQMSLIYSLHYLFNFQTNTNEYPLRACLTRMILYNANVEAMGLRYYQKKEILLFALKDFRVCMENAIAQCPNNENVLREINVFINDFATYGIREPVLRPSNLKRWIIIVLIIGSITWLCHYIGTWDRFKAIIHNFVESTTKAFGDTLVKNFSEPTAKALIKEMKDNGVELGTKLGSGLVDTIKVNGIELGTGLGNGLVEALKDKKIGETLGNDLLNGLTFDTDGNGVKIPNKALNSLPQVLINNATYAALKNPGFKDVKLRILGNVLTNIPDDQTLLNNRNIANTQAYNEAGLEPFIGPQPIPQLPPQQNINPTKKKSLLNTLTFGLFSN